MGLSITCSPTKPKRPLPAKLSARTRLYMYGRPLRSPYSYMVSISQSAGAEPLPEREVSSHNPFSFNLCRRVSISQSAGAESLPEREVSSHNPFSFNLCRLRRHKLKTNEVALEGRACA